MSNNVIMIRLLGMVVACLALPPLLCRYAGPALGLLGALGAGALWYSQFRFPLRKERTGAYYWFVTGGYVAIGITLVVCLGRVLGVRLFL